MKAKARGKKHPGGRPSTYKGADTIRLLEAFIEEMTDDFDNWLRHCDVAHLALRLGRNRDTVNEWQKQYPEFSVAVKKWRDRRNAIFWHLFRRIDPTRWIYLSKQREWLDMSDKRELGLANAPDANGKPQALIIEIVDPAKK